MIVALEGGELSAARPVRNLPRESSGTHFTVGWVGPMPGLDGWNNWSPEGFDSEPFRS